MLGKVVVGAAKIAATGIIADELRKRAAPTVEKGAEWLEAKVTDGINKGKEYLSERKRISALQREHIQTIGEKFELYQEHVSNMHPRWGVAEHAELVAALDEVISEGEGSRLGKFAVAVHNHVAEFRLSVRKMMEDSDENGSDKNRDPESSYQRAARSNASKARGVILEEIKKVSSSPVQVLIALSLRDRLVD